MRKVALAILLTSCGHQTAQPTKATVKTAKTSAKRTLEFFETRPLLERPLDGGLVPVQGVGSPRAEVCGQCHPDIYAEWSLSTHRHAWHDQQFQAETAKSGNLWLCRNCHTPSLAQQELWPIGLEDNDVERPILIANPDYNASFEDEGITCVACHVRDGVIHGPGLENSTSTHPVVASDDYRSEKLCVRCHQAEAVYPGKTFVCTFQTGDEWRAGPAAERGQTCVHCHMPEVEGPVAVGGPIRTRRRHWFAGSGIAKVADSAPPLDAPPGWGLDLSARTTPAGLELSLGNLSGHKLPTGDPERWIQIDVHFLGKDDAAIGEPWTYRIGQIWEWHPAPKKVSDNRLLPGGSRTLPVPVPPGTAYARIDAASHRMSKKNAEYHHLHGYPLSVQSHSLRVDVRH